MKNIVLIITAITFIFSSCVSEQEIKNRGSHGTIPVKLAKYVKVNTPQQLGVIHKSTVSDFNKAINNKTGILVDVRTPEEYKESHLEGSVNVNFKKRTFPSYISALDKNQPVLIYCRSGNRSGKAAKIMQSLGFKEVYDLSKGFKGWNAEKKPITKEDSPANIALQSQLKSTPPTPKTINTLGQGIDVEEVEFEKLIQSGKVTLVDVRTPKEFAEGHIPGSLNVDWKNRHFTEHILKISNIQPVAIYCRSGNRSTRAMYAMKSLGFTKVYNLTNGFKSWKAANKAVESTNIGKSSHTGAEEGC